MRRPSMESMEGQIPPEELQKQQESLLYDYIKARREVNKTETWMKKGFDRPSLQKEQEGSYRLIDEIGRKLDSMGIGPAEIDEYEKNKFPEMAFKRLRRSDGELREERNLLTPEEFNPPAETAHKRRQNVIKETRAEVDAEDASK